ncbi:hypothetical protein PTSG_09285 [Salpingoeca rosetta]|uniref:Uncharacterized protein n=1 Tax=Salpingoeca rosetta (strain ATCC 50818 / BSB-021) TaxID=946362 RepID=F2UN94_SALR5|nr:uncharacterized protein PTSG_09285 [Salpingoeca rosetta]EGD78593.1 hypothetical protein PTSG_09285 [Salpingoeca rosetta]|eukprot:XP_004989542.1 hypothetical protein PTSG_09285 [Salpingoeca rosetta]
MSGGEKRAREEVEALLAQTKLMDGVKHKIRAIANNTCGDYENLGGYGLGAIEARAVAEALKDNTCLKRLYLWGNSIGPEGAVALAEMLKHNTTLERLSLRWNSIGDEGAAALAEMLKHNTTLEELSLYNNSIGDEGAVALAEMLKHNTALETLYLDNNSIGDQGAVVLAEMLKHNTTMTGLNLGANSIGDEGAVALAEMLKHNTALKELYLEGNSIGNQGAVALAEMLKHNTTLERLFLERNRVGDKGAVALAEMLKHNTTLTGLNLGANSIGDEGAVALAEMLKHNTTLTWLGIGRNRITERGMVNVLKQLQHIDAKAKIRLFEDKLKSSTAVARALATLRTKQPDINVVFAPFDSEDKFDSSAKAAYQDRLDLLRLLETGSVPLETAKVFVCGDYGIGKTTMIESLPGSLFRRFTRTIFQPANDPDRSNERTPGIRVCEMKLKDTTSQGSDGDNAASLRVYDFGGQLAYHVIHTLMMSDRFAAFVVCVDLSEPKEHVKERANYWLQFICTRLQQGIAAATATADGGAMEEVKPRVVIAGTKRDLARDKALVDEHGHPPWGTAMVADLRRQSTKPGSSLLFGDIVDIQDSFITLNCHQGGEAGFDVLRSQLVDHWHWLRGREVLVPQVVNEVAGALKKAVKNKAMWSVGDLLDFVRGSGNGIDLISAIQEGTFHQTLRYLHTRGDLLWYSSTPSLADFVFVDPNWLLHDVLGRALTPDGVQQGSITKKGVVTFTDLETAFRGIATADLVISVLQHTLLCFELPPSNDGQRQFMLPSRVEKKADLATAWPRTGFWPVYGGRLLVVESKALALPPGFFPHVQTLLHKSFGATLKVWPDAFFCEHDGVQCLGLLRGEREVDVWVRAPSGAEHKALPFMTKVLSVLQGEARGIDHVHLVLSTKHLKRHEKYPAAHKLGDLTGKDPDELVTSTHHRESQNPVSDRVGDLLLQAPAHPPPVMPSWQLRDHEWHHPAWRLDDAFDEQLPWRGPSEHGVYSAPLPPDTDLYRWIESRMTPGLTLSRVEMIKSTMMLRAFKAQVERSATRRGDTKTTNKFNKDFGLGDPEKRAMLKQLKMQFAKTRTGLKHVNILVGFHGCDEAVADSISACGAANFSSPGDRGFFGSGIYLTPQTSYAAGYSTRVLLNGDLRSSNANGEHVMLLCAASVGLAYPITRAADYPHGSNECSYYGKPFDESQDTHYAQVTRATNLQATPTPGTFAFEEYVVSQEAQVLPFAKVFVKVDMGAYLSHLSTLP